MDELIARLIDEHGYDPAEAALIAELAVQAAAGETKKIVRAEIDTGIEKALASLAGTVLERIEQSGVTDKDPAHRTSGAHDLSGALAGAFGELLRKRGRTGSSRRPHKPAA